MGHPGRAKNHDRRNQQQKCSQQDHLLDDLGNLLIGLIFVDLFDRRRTPLVQLSFGSGAIKFVILLFDHQKETIVRRAAES